MFICICRYVRVCIYIYACIYIYISLSLSLSPAEEASPRPLVQLRFWLQRSAMASALSAAASAAKRAGDLKAGDGGTVEARLNRVEYSIAWYRVIV